MLSLPWAAAGSSLLVAAGAHCQNVNGTLLSLWDSGVTLLVLVLNAVTNIILVAAADSCQVIDVTNQHLLGTV